MGCLVLFVAFLIGLLWLFQIIMLDDFYRWDKTRQVRQMSSLIADNADNESLPRLMDRLAQENDTCILLLDSEYRKIASADVVRFCLIHRMSRRDLSWWCSRAPEDGSVATELFQINPYAEEPSDFPSFRGFSPPREGENRQSLLCARRITLKDGSTGYLLLNAIITPLDSTVVTLRNQLIIITGVVLLGALLLAFLISRAVTRPIVETNAAARALSRGQYAPPEHGSNYREMAELNQTLTAAAHEISQVDRLQHELIANISHDLRTPLTMIAGYAEVMRDIPGESTPENMQIIIDETQRLTSLVSEVMDFSRLESGALTLAPAPFGLTASLRAIVGRISKLIEKDGYVIRFEPQEELSAIADEARISQVVYNLLGNALTYTGPDKTVTLTQERRGDHVRIAVQDSGQGIPQEELPLIWNRYYRAKESHRRAVIGSGLGLSIVRSILEKHGVDFGVRSEEGAGTTFWFDLRCTENAQDA